MVSQKGTLPFYKHHETVSRAYLWCCLHLSLKVSSDCSSPRSSSNANHYTRPSQAQLLYLSPTSQGTLLSPVRCFQHTQVYNTAPAYASPLAAYRVRLDQEMTTPPRRSSLGMLLRRSKSSDLKRQQAAKELELQRQREAVPKSPPRLPVLYNGAPAPQLGLGGENRPDSLAILSGHAEHMSGPSPRPSMEPSRSAISVPPPPIPNGGFDPYAGAGSMAHRGRYSYASSAVSTINSPRRVRRRKDPTPFK